MKPVITIGMARLKSVLKQALVSVLAIVFLLAGIWIWIGVRVGIWTYPQYDRHIWLVKECPIAHDFWAGKIKAGDNVEALIQKWPPHHMDRFGPWVSLDWFPGGPFTNAVISFIGINATAKNGVLVCASAYSDDGGNDRVFFNTVSTNDEADYEAEFHKYVNDRMDKIQKNEQVSNGISTTSRSPK